MDHLGTSELETERLLLRKFQIDDAPIMYQNWTSDEEVTKYLTWATHQSLQDTQDYVNFCISSYDNPQSYRWLIIEKDSQQLIGDISVVSIEDKTKTAGLGWVLARQHWGKGYMPEAANTVLDYLFEQVGFNRIYAVHDSQNPQSGRVMEKIGMTYEGTMRQAGCNNRGHVDLKMYAILKEDRKSR